jgi:recombination protein RecR
MAAQALDELIQQLGRLPGLGPRSARRVALHLLKQRQTLLPRLAAALGQAAQEVRQCAVCSNLDDADPCRICTDPERDPSQICIVEEVDDLWALERSGLFKGRYHVLGGRLSALDGLGPEDLGIDRLLQRGGAPLRSSSLPARPSMARPPPTISPSASRRAASRSPGWRTACRSAAS